MSVYDEVDCVYDRIKHSDSSVHEKYRSTQQAQDELFYFATIWDVQRLIKQHGWEKVKSDILGA